MSYKQHYSEFFKANPDKLHFTAHSHHPWPDATRAAHLKYWDDSTRLTDQKWDHIFETVIPEAQAHVAAVLGLSAPQNIAFAPNTHELVARLLSCFEISRPLRILTTDSEFHSFARQVRRYEELPNVAVKRVPVEPFASFEDRFCAELVRDEIDLVFISHVFFNSGFALESPGNIVNAVRSDQTIVAIDGYHSFCALPINLSTVQDRIFYLGGGYKYAQCGEGACFMHVPAGCMLRPLHTGWFACFESLDSYEQLAEVRYAPDGFRFWGATFDPSGLYRMNAVMRWMNDTGLTVERIHAHVQSLQTDFLEGLDQLNHKHLHRGNLLQVNPERHGHFLTFRTELAGEIKKELGALQISTDHRQNLLRFGFGIYQDLEDIARLFERLERSNYFRPVR